MEFIFFSELDRFSFCAFLSLKYYNYLNFLLFLCNFSLFVKINAN